MNNTYKCFLCEQEFIKRWSDEQAHREAKGNFGIDNAAQRKDMIILLTPDSCILL